MLLFFNIIVGVIIGLHFKKIFNTVPYFNHTLNSVLTCFGGFYLSHNRVFSVIDSAVHNSIRIVANIRVGRDIVYLVFLNIFNGVFRDFAIYVLYGNIELFLKSSVLIGFTSTFRLKSSRLHNHFAEYHIGMLNKILIHSYSVSIFVKE